MKIWINMIENMRVLDFGYKYMRGGGEYKTNEMNEYRNNYSNNDCRI